MEKKSLTAHLRAATDLGCSVTYGLIKDDDWFTSEHEALYRAILDGNDEKALEALRAIQASDAPLEGMDEALAQGGFALYSTSEEN